jgi:hypothetical protein
MFRPALILVSMLMGIAINAVNVFAANHYVRTGATGNGDDWANALGALPATLTRGDVYYLAGGVYGSYTFDDAISGTQIITVRKATADDHGTATGWNSTYGNSVASFTEVAFATSYYVFDGVTGGGPGQWNSGFGFEITRTTSTCGDNGNLLTFAAPVSDIIVRHVHMYSGSKNYPLMGIKGTASNSIIAYNSIHTIFGGQFHMNSWSNVVIEYNYLADNRSTGAGDLYCSDWHSEGISSIGTNQNVTIRYNLWDKITGTAVIAGINSNTDEAWKVYGNIFSRSTTTLYSYYAGTNSSVVNNLEFYNNIITGIPGVSQGGIVINQGTNNKVYNNIWYNNIANAFGINAAHGWNYFAENRRVEGCSPGPCDKDAEAATGDTAAQLGPASSPFVNADSSVDPLVADFHLKAATNAGKTLAAPFNMDMFGNTRGADGVWDRGVVEYSTTGLRNADCGMRNDASGRPLVQNPVRSLGLLRALAGPRETIFDMQGNAVSRKASGPGGVYLVKDKKTGAVMRALVVR